MYLYRRQQQHLKSRQLYFLLHHGIQINYNGNDEMEMEPFLYDLVNAQDISLLERIFRYYQFNQETILKFIQIQKIGRKQSNDIQNDNFKDKNTLVKNNQGYSQGLSTLQLQHLLEKGKQKVYLTRKMYTTALHHKNLELLRLLYQYDTKEHLTQVNHSYTILYKACSYPENLPIIQFLIEEAGADVNEQVKDTLFTPLMMTAQEGFADYAEFLIEKGGAKIDAQDSRGFTPLMFASHNGQEAVVKILIKHGAKVNMVNGHHSTALVYACQEENVGVVQYLLEHGADPNIKDGRESTPLMSAVQSGNHALVQVLLQNPRLTYNEKNYNGWNALMYACFGGHVDLVQELMSKGESIQDKDVNGFTSLMIACLGGKKSIVDYLLDQGVDINAKNKSGATALMVVSQNGHRDIVQVLIDHGANINDTDHIGNSALIYATINKQIGIAEFLIQRGANLNIRNHQGDTPLILACNNGSRQFIELFIRYGTTTINTPNHKNLTPLKITQMRGFNDLSTILLANGADSPSSFPSSYSSSSYTHHPSYSSSSYPHPSTSSSSNVFYL